MDAQFKDFIALVRTMRDTQKAYFKNRQDSDLKLSKQLERQVDEWIKNSGSTQSNLFSNTKTTT